MGPKWVVLTNRLSAKHKTSATLTKQLFLCVRYIACNVIKLLRHLIPFQVMWDKFMQTQNLWVFHSDDVVTAVIIVTTLRLCFKALWCIWIGLFPVQVRDYYTLLPLTISKSSWKCTNPAMWRNRQTTGDKEWVDLSQNPNLGIFICINLFRDVVRIRNVANNNNNNFIICWT